jgi:hypothetical protein
LNYYEAVDRGLLIFNTTFSMLQPVVSNVNILWKLPLHLQSSGSNRCLNLFAAATCKKISTTLVVPLYFYLIIRCFMKKLAILPALFLLASTTSFAAGPFEEKDFNWDASTNLHKDLIIAGVNNIARDDERCADIDPKTARVDYNHGNPDNPAFAVTCGTSDHPITVFFTKVDVEAAEAAAKKK